MPILSDQGLQCLSSRVGPFATVGIWRFGRQLLLTTRCYSNPFP